MLCLAWTNPRLKDKQPRGLDRDTPAVRGPAGKVSPARPPSTIRSLRLDCRQLCGGSFWAHATTDRSKGLLRMARTSLAVSVLCVAASVSGCLFTSDLDRFEQAGAGGSAGTGGTGGTSGTGGSDSLDCDNPRNVCLRLSDFAARADQLVQADLVADDFLRARAVFDPIEGEGDVEVILPLAIGQADITAETAFDVQLLADENADRAFNPDDDATWLAQVPASGNAEISNATTPAAQLDRPRELDGDFTLQLTRMTAHDSQLLEVWVQEDASGRTAGYYRMPEVPASGDFTITIPGIIGDPGSVYRIQFYADFDENGVYEPRADNPAGDHSWVRTATADDSGITLAFEHTGVFEDLDIPVGYGF